MMAAFGAPGGQGLVQVGELLIALVLSAAIGVEREIRQKSAGLRTHTLVGFASALFMLVSKYGFADVPNGHTSLDPSRVAAQIVSGIGFIGGGLIFVRRDAVRGLTTAAAVWLTAAVGMAAGAGLWLLALVVAGGYFLVMLALTPLAARLPRSKYAPSALHVTYLDARGVLRRVLEYCTDRGLTVDRLSVDHGDPESGTVSVWLTVQGSRSPTELAAELAEIDGVLTVTGADENAQRL
jgi:putative Mg2+ transporter-C (MgtC) family protein